MQIRNYLLSISFALFLVSCSKDKFDTTPSLEIKDYNTKVVPVPPAGFASYITIRLDYRDKEGDVKNGSLYVQRVRLNSKPLGTNDPARPDGYRGNIGEVTNRDRGEFTFSLEWNDLRQTLSENDTLRFRFALTDEAGNTSDTLDSEPIVVLKD